MLLVSSKLGRSPSDSCKAIEKTVTAYICPNATAKMPISLWLCRCGYHGNLITRFHPLLSCLGDLSNYFVCHDTLVP